MKKSKEELCKKIKNICESNISDSKKHQECCVYLLEEYNIPITISSDIMSLRRDASEYSDFILYCILEAISKKDISKYFVNEEIKIYSSTKYERKSIDFPIVFKMIQVEYDQWIGTIDAKKIIELRDAQLINYNENAQRAFKRIIKGEKEYYKISIDSSAVKSIKKAFHDEIYIPNTITLNISEENTDWFYDEEKCELVVNSIDYFDITDGYHRYIALGQEMDLNEDFNYNMELRITNFAINKSQQFIFQEDQKTKMKKVDSMSYNQYNAGNIVVQRLNSDPLCDLSGCIVRNGRIINAADLANYINFFYFKGIKNENEKVRIIEIENELKEKFNLLINYDVSYLTKNYSVRELMVLVYIFSKYNKEEIIKKVEKINNYGIDKLDCSIFSTAVPRKKALNILDDILK